jgi:hypothetical protein
MKKRLFLSFFHPGPPMKLGCLTGPVHTAT